MPDTLPDRMAQLVHDALPYRELTVSISRADERRLHRAIARFNDEMPGDPLLFEDGDLAIVFAGAALRGLHDGESDDGVWSDIDGTLYDLPRRVRSPWHLRLKFAWRAARTTWRST